MKKEQILNRNLNESILNYADIPTIDLIKLSNGNKKLAATNDYQFLIWNIPAIRTCPFATESCKAACYAIKAEYIYPSALESRERHFAATLRADFVPAMIAIIEKQIKKDKRYLLFRIHESGDFYSREYLFKWEQIAAHFIGRKITFQAYTKSINFVNPICNIHFTYSIWDDTKPEAIALASKKGLQTYSAVKACDFDDVPDVNKCLCVDCGNCRKCYSGFDSVIVAIH